MRYCLIIKNMVKEKIAEIIQTSLNYIEAKEYKSYDLFDALTNPIVNNLTYPSTFLQRVANQINSRSPLTLHWTGMKKMVHTKLISDLVWLYSLNNSKNQAFRLYKYLLSLKIKGEELVWGLNFPYTSSFVKAGYNTPNLYNTSTSGLAICELCYIDKKNLEEYHKQINEITISMFHVFKFHDETTKGWFSYYPGQLFPTYNVNALAIYFLCKANNSLNSQIVSPEFIEKIIQLLINEQNPDGSWYYSRSLSGRRIDGFHTGFIIESLAYVYSNGHCSARLLETLEKAWNYYIKTLFTLEGYPKYYNTSSKFPIEAQNYAQAIQTLSLLGMWMGWHHKELLGKVIEYAISNLYHSSGFFYHKKTRYVTYKSSYFRWSTSPMLIALTYAQHYIENKN
jgi:hypothetical protein